MMFVLVACSTNQQEEVHYIAKSEHWKAVYHSNTEEGLRFYLGEEKDLGDLQITIEGSKESTTINDARINTDKQWILTKKESAKMFKKEAAPIIRIQWQSYNVTLE